MEMLYLFIFIAAERLSRQRCLSIPTVTAYLIFVFNSVNIAAKEKYLKREKSISGVWIIDGKDVFYNQFAQVTFLCPMRFERYPLDEHTCKFRVGSTNMDINYMRFGETAVTYDESSRNTILDYKVEAMKLREEDRILLYQGGNYSVTGQTGTSEISRLIKSKKG